MVVLGVLLTSKEWRVVGAAFSSASKKDRSFLSLLKQKLNDCLWFYRGEISRIRQGDGTWIGFGIRMANWFNSHAKCDQLVRAAWSPMGLWDYPSS